MMELVVVYNRETEDNEVDWLSKSVVTRVKSKSFSEIVCLPFSVHGLCPQLIYLQRKWYSRKIGRQPSPLTYD